MDAGRPRPPRAVGVRWLISEQGMSVGNTLTMMGVAAGSLCQGASKGFWRLKREEAVTEVGGG